MLKKIYENICLRKYFLTPFAYNINPNKISFLALTSALLQALSFTRETTSSSYFVLLNGYFDLLDERLQRSIIEPASRRFY